MKKLRIISVIALSLFLCGSLLAGGAMAEKKPVVVYTSMETDETVEYLKVAKKQLCQRENSARGCWRRGKILRRTASGDGR
jgi:hypothetical protein